MWYNTLVNLFLRTPLHGVISSGIMSLTYTGRKSGRSYTIPVNYVPLPDNPDVLLTTSLRKRVWWRNLRDGAPVTLRLRGRKVSATATAIEEETAVADLLVPYLTRMSNIADQFDVGLDEEGIPRRADTAVAAQTRVIIRTVLDE